MDPQTQTLITGCSTGIGHATARLFAERGARVIATMRNPGRDPSRGDDLVAAGCTVVALDVTDTDQVQRVVAEAEAGDAGPIGVLVNNAGVGFTGAVEVMPDDLVRATFETNLFGPWALIRAVLPGMRRRRSGAVVNVSSVNGYLAIPGGAAYAASKFALEGMSEALALEVAQFGIRVTTVAPGFITTAIATTNRPLSRLDPASPYADLEERVADYLGDGVAGGEPPAVVAETIWEAVHGDRPRHRVAAGADAAGIIASRRTSPDDAWLAGMRATFGLAGLPDQPALPG
jgi:NAD(P)-dependent dehydrogenase (short-subunit alcohol dehydrogenase family)